jgi:hypothetical protein
MKIGSQSIDAAIHQFKEVTLPQAWNIAGFQGATMLVDREKGMTRTLTYWDSRESLEASAETANRLRTAFVQEAGDAKLISVETFEVAVDEGQWKLGKVSS